MVIMSHWQRILNFCSLVLSRLDLAGVAALTGSTGYLWPGETGEDRRRGCAYPAHVFLLLSVRVVVGRRTHTPAIGNQLGEVYVNKVSIYTYVSTSVWIWLSERR